MTEESPAPAPAAPATTPRRWLGRKGSWIILGGFALIWLYLLLFDSLVVGSRSVSITAIILGSFGLAAALLYTMAYRLRPQDGISVTRLLLAFLIGGLLSTVAASTANWFVYSASSGGAASAACTSGGPTLWSTSLAGVIEELFKILAVVIVARGLANKTARNGLFIGGAVGLGFSAIEDMSYQLQAWACPLIPASHVGSLITVTIARDLIGPLEHPLFTALLAAALFGAVRNGRYRITLPVIGTYLGLAVVHGLIDSGSQLVRLATHSAGLAGFLGLAIDVVLALATGIVWLVVARRLRDGQRADSPPPVTRVTLLDQYLPAADSTAHVEVRRIEMPPDVTGGAHIHNGPVFGSIERGSVVFQVGDGEGTLLHAGDVFYEPEGAVVTRFDTGADGVVFLGYFLLKAGQAPELTPHP